MFGKDGTCRLGLQVSRSVTRVLRETQNTVTAGYLAMLWRDRTRQKLQFVPWPHLCTHLSASSVVSLILPEMGEGWGRDKEELWGGGEVVGSRLRLLSGD